MGLLDLFKRSAPTKLVPVVRERHPAPITPRRLVRELVAKHPDGVPDWDEVDTHGLDLQAVVAAYDDALAYANEDKRVKVRTVKPAGLRILDLTGLESVRMRIKGPAYWLRDPERKKFGGREYLLIREPDNETDGAAVAVYGVAGRKVGHISASRSASLAPVLDGMNADAFRVTGAGVTANSSQLWVDVPKMDALRRFARTH
ncbi:HIRAN domain-containing protein [Promicromonospora aerolata]|uniref:HIRAN domain-containing protein n=1 Tax=Promicromonospora aerolata TaxID=195749 RepID=A0ABW4V1B8_9MICO